MYAIQYALQYVVCSTVCSSYRVQYSIVADLTLTGMMGTQTLSHTDIHSSEPYKKQSKNNTCYRRNKPRSRVKTSSCNTPHSRHSPLHPAPLEHPGSFLFLCSPFIRKELQLRREGGGRCGHYGGGVVWELQVPEPDRGWSKPHTVQ